MAQIFVFGRVGEDLVAKTSQKNSPYVCFSLKEQLGKGRTQFYQVWAWNEDVSRLLQFGVKKDSHIWITGTMQMVDCTTDHGKEKTKVLKIFLTNWGYLPGRHSKRELKNVTNESEQVSDSLIPPTEVLDGDCTALPE